MVYSLRYIGAYQIAKRTGKVAYEFELPQELVAIHPVFHISMLNKCMGDPSLIIPTQDRGIKDSLSYEEIPVQILDLEIHNLRSKEVTSVNVLGVTNLFTKVIGKVKRIRRRSIYISLNLEMF